MVHHTALPYVDLPSFVSVLQRRTGVDARALKFTILTAARFAMTFLAIWRHIDFDTATWNVPEAYMKGGRPFRIPLSEEAVAVL